MWSLVSSLCITRVSLPHGIRAIRILICPLPHTCCFAINVRSPCMLPLGVTSASWDASSYDLISLRATFFNKNTRYILLGGGFSPSPLSKIKQSFLCRACGFFFWFGGGGGWHGGHLCNGSPCTEASSCCRPNGGFSSRNLQSPYVTCSDQDDFIVPHKAGWYGLSVGRLTSTAGQCVSPETSLENHRFIHSPSLYL